MDRCIRVVMLSFYHGHQRDVRDSTCLKGTDSPDVSMFFSVCLSLSLSLSLPLFERRFPATIREPRFARGSRKLGFIETCPLGVE